MNERAQEAVTKRGEWAPGPNAYWRKNSAHSEVRRRTKYIELLWRNTEWGQVNFVLMHSPAIEDTPESWYLERGQLANGVPEGPVYFKTRNDVLRYIDEKYPPRADLIGKAADVIKAAAPELRALLRTAAEIDTEAWLKKSLPKAHTMPPASVIAAQMVDLRDSVLVFLKGQEQRYIAHVRTNPPTLSPIGKAALDNLPPETALTHHGWLEGVVANGAYDDTRALTGLLHESLQEAIGTGGVAARKPAGGLPPGLSALSQTEAGALRRQIGAFKGSSDPGTRAMYEAVAERARDRAVRAAVLRDGAGRPLGAATYTSMGDTIDVRLLGTLDAAVPGTGLQMIREMAGIAASAGKGLTLTAPPESMAVYAALGFRQPIMKAVSDPGNLNLDAAAAAKLAAGVPTEGPAWIQTGFLEGSAGQYTLATTPEEIAAVQASLDDQWPFPSKAYTIANDALNPAFEQAQLGYIRGSDGTLKGVVSYLLPEEPGSPIHVLNVAAIPKGEAASESGIGRLLMRKVAEVARDQKSGIILDAKPGSQGFYGRLGMTATGKSILGLPEYAFSAEAAAAFAPGLTLGATFLGQTTWDLAVAGASEWLAKDVIAGVVDEVTATTHQALVDALGEGLSRGEGTDTLIARIRNLDSTTFGLARAERIARTEVITANRMGGLTIATDAGAQTKKWLSRLMPNTRAWHRAAHGQVVAVKDPFSVANGKGDKESLLVPGDRSLGASADNVINCACGVAYLKLGVTDGATFDMDQHGLADVEGAPGPVVAGVAGTQVPIAKNLGWVAGPNAHWERTDNRSDAQREADLAPYPTAVREGIARLTAIGVDFSEPLARGQKITAREIDKIETAVTNSRSRTQITLPIKIEDLSEKAITANYSKVDGGTIRLDPWADQGVEMEVGSRIRTVSQVYPEYEGVLVHETGHHVATLFPDDYRAAKAFMHATPTRWLTNQISTRASVNGIESWAESFALYVSDDFGKLPLATRGFVEQLLGSQVTGRWSRDSIHKETDSQAWAEAVMKNLGWAPGPDAHWRRTDGSTSGAVVRLFHGTNEQASGEIGAGGFHSSGGPDLGGYRFGAGVYLTPNKDEAQFWADRAALKPDAGAPVVLNVSATVGNMRTLTIGQYIKEVDPYVAEQKAAGALKDLSIEAWAAKLAHLKADYFQAQGYDSIHVKGGGPKKGEGFADYLNRTGGDQIVVFDSKRIATVVHKNLGWAPGPDARWRRTDEDKAEVGNLRTNVEILAYHGGGHEGPRWFTTDREHAGYFGETAQYKLTIGRALEIDKDQHPQLRDLSGYEADGALEGILRDSGADAVLVRNWEGSGLTILIDDRSVTPEPVGDLAESELAQRIAERYRTKYGTEANPKRTKGP